MIREVILSTSDSAASVHLAPIGLIEEESGVIVAPFRPSRTLENLRAVPFAVANYCDDVRIFAGCLSGRCEWPWRNAERVPGAVLAAALAHAELAVERVEEDALRPRFHCRVVHEAMHAPWRGFNRARAAVIEAAILVSRLEILPRKQILRELGWLQVALDKTAGPAEHEAWQWLMERVAAERARVGGTR